MKKFIVLILTISFVLGCAATVSGCKVTNPFAKQPAPAVESK